MNAGIVAFVDLFLRIPGFLNSVRIGNDLDKGNLGCK